MNKSKIHLILFAISTFCFFCGMTLSALAADDVIAMNKVKDTFRKVVPRKINIGDINLYIPDIEVGVPETGIYSVQFDGGELEVDKDGNEKVSQAIAITVWLYVDILERDPGVGATAYNELIKNWDKTKGELVEYSVEMPPYFAAYHTKTNGKDGKPPYEVNILSPVGDNFLIKISLSTNKESMNLEQTIKLTKDLLDYLVRKAMNKAELVGKTNEDKQKK